MSSLGSLGTRDTVTRRVTSSGSVSRSTLRERDLVTRELHDGSEGSREPGPDEDTRPLELEAAGNTGSVSAVLVFLDDVLGAGVLGGASLIASSLFSPTAETLVLLLVDMMPFKLFWTWDRCLLSTSAKESLQLS